MFAAGGGIPWKLGDLLQISNVCQRLYPSDSENAVRVFVVIISFLTCTIFRFCSRCTLVSLY